MDNALVLIVEDEPEIIEILETYFSREGFRTISASDGTIGLLHHQRLKPDRGSVPTIMSSSRSIPLKWSLEPRPFCAAPPAGTRSSQVGSDH